MPIMSFLFRILSNERLAHIKGIGWQGAVKSGTWRYRFSQIKLQNRCYPQVADIPILARIPCNYLGENL
jgi:hypothetical protein